MSELMREFVRRQREERDYHAFLKRKVEVARSSVRAGNGRPNDEVEVDFAARRAKVARGA